MNHAGEKEFFKMVLSHCQSPQVPSSAVTSVSIGREKLKQNGIFKQTKAMTSGQAQQAR